MIDEIPRADVRYAQAGNHAIAYQVIGDGPIDLVFVDQWFSNVDAMWEFRPLAELLGKLGAIQPSHRLRQARHGSFGARSRPTTYRRSKSGSTIFGLFSTMSVRPGTALMTGRVVRR